MSNRWHFQPCWIICVSSVRLVFTFGPFTEKLINGTREALCVHGSPGQSQSPPAGGGGGGGGMGSRRGSISSLSSVTSMLEEKDDEKIRCCHHCMDTLLKRQQKLEEKDHTPDIVKLYEVGKLKGNSQSTSCSAVKSVFSFQAVFSLFSYILPVKPCFSFGVSCCSLAQNLSSCQRLRMCMEKVDEKAPEYIRMAESLK